MIDSNIVLIPVFLFVTSSAINLNYETMKIDDNVCLDIPQKEAIYLPTDNEGYSNQMDFSLVNNDVQDFLVLENFIKKMIANIEPMDPEIAAVIDECFWDML
jgi:hypothetical protein